MLSKVFPQNSFRTLGINGSSINNLMFNMKNASALIYPKNHLTN